MVWARPLPVRAPRSAALVSPIISSGVHFSLATPGIAFDWWAVSPTAALIILQDLGSTIVASALAGLLPAAAGLSRPSLPAIGGRSPPPMPLSLSRTWAGNFLGLGSCLRSATLRCLGLSVNSLGSPCLRDATPRGFRPLIRASPGGFAHYPARLITLASSSISPWSALPASVLLALGSISLGVLYPPRALSPSECSACLELYLLPECSTRNEPHLLGVLYSPRALSPSECPTCHCAPPALLWFPPGPPWVLPPSKEPSSASSTINPTAPHPRTVPSLGSILAHSPGSPWELQSSKEPASVSSTAPARILRHARHHTGVSHCPRAAHAHPAPNPHHSYTIRPAL